MTRFDFHQVDVFTAQPLRGNPLAVVIGADKLDDSQMAAFANWTNLSETTFLLRPTTDVADYRVRIFTPQRELPFAGHPTLGSCHVWLASGANPKGDEIVQQCEIGLVRIRRSPDRLFFAAPDLLRTGELEPELLNRVIKGLRLTPDAAIGANWVDNGPGWLAVLVRSRDVVMSVRPRHHDSCRAARRSCRGVGSGQGWFGCSIRGAGIHLRRLRGSRHRQPECRTCAVADRRRHCSIKLCGKPGLSLGKDGPGPHREDRR
jgi:predicted PhzF superfamily epimerase YddE/YHI9